MKLFLDTNIFLRLVTEDDREMSEECKQLLALVETGKIIPYFSSMVIAEIIFTLIRSYKFEKARVLDFVADIINLRNATLIDKSQTKAALKLYQKYNVKYGDCVIASQIPPNVAVCSYDPELPKIVSLEVVTPMLVLSRLRPKQKILIN